MKPTHIVIVSTVCSLLSLLLLVVVLQSTRHYNESQSHNSNNEAVTEPYSQITPTLNVVRSETTNKDEDKDWVDLEPLLRGIPIYGGGSWIDVFC